MSTFSIRASPFYLPSNGSVVRARDWNGPKVGRAIRVLCGYPEGKGNPLCDWYKNIPEQRRLIQKIQLRKEHQAPFFHEFIVFSLHHDGGYFRLERRQLPDEVSPLDCAAVEGVEAHDTIEEVRGFDDPCLSSSDCLVQVEFGDGLHLARLLRACQAMQNHRKARMYTLQRYNCYFFAQTMIFCSVSSILQPKCSKGSVVSDESHVFLRSFSSVGKLAPAPNLSTGQLPAISLPFGTLQRPSLSMSSVPSRPLASMLLLQLTAPVQDINRGINIQIMNNIPILPEPKRSGWFDSRKPQEATWEASRLRPCVHEGLQEYLEQLIGEHSRRVETYKLLNDCTAQQLSEEIISAMFDVWQESKPVNEFS